LIDEASALQGPAANALLKTLEEPPARTHFVLASNSPDALLTTIRSRCQRVNFQALPPELRASIQGEDEHADKVHALSEAILAAVDQRGLGGILDAASQSGDRALLEDALTQCAHRCHQMAREEVDRGQLARASALSARARVILDTERAVHLHNAHGQLAVEHLLVELRGLPLPEVMA
jgi:DNA polymerase-3 subunit delta'